MKTKITSSLPVLFLTIKLCAQTVPAYVSINGLKAYWPFTGNANDVSINVNNGTVTGATPTTDRFNTPACAYLYNGFSDYVSTNYPGILGTGARAVSFWAAVDVSATTHLEVIGWGSNDNTSASTGKRINIAFNNIGGTFYPSVSSAYCIWGQNPEPPVSDQVWHHFVFQVAANSTVGDVEIYEDAIKLNNPTTSQNTATNVPFNTSNGTNMVTIGMLDQVGTPLFFFKGKLDDIGIWDRVLSICEISKLYYANANIGSMTFNPAGYSGSLINLAQYTQTVSGSGQFPTPIIASVFSGTGVSFNGGQYNFNSPATLPPGSYTITHSYTLQGGCVQASTNTIMLIPAVGLHERNGEDKSNIYLFPNPAHSQFNIVSDIENENLNISITDMAGKIILNQNIISGAGEGANVSQLENGLYLVAIRSRSENTIYKKLFIARQ